MRPLPPPTSLLPFLLLLLPINAWAETPSAEEILVNVDNLATLSSDFSAKLEITTVEKDGDETKRSVKVWQKGTARRMVQITSPKRLRGVGLLNADGKIHLYLPAFDKVRRVAEGDQESPFFDSVFTQGDMARTNYSDDFSPSLIESAERHWVLKLTPKHDDLETHHLVLKVRKDDYIVSKASFYNDDGDSPARTVEASEISVVGDVLPLAFKVVATDHETGDQSTALFDEVQLNQELDDDFFSTRSLKRTH